jgi:anionic cell wall polymer biosynthesis LytR-Cps2A-Psr (LCP) family protein
MIEYDLHDAFARHEADVPDAALLGPAIARGVRTRRRRRRAAWSITAVVALAMAAPTGLVRLASGATRSLASGVGLSSDGAAIRGSMNFLLLGLDREPGQGDPGRSDTMLLIHVNGDHTAVSVLSIERDLWAEIPGHGFNKINSAYALGGFPLAEHTVEKLTGVQLDGGAEVTFSGLERLTDAVGGVSLCVDVRVESHHLGRDRSGAPLPPYIGDNGDVRDPRSTPVVYEPGCRRFSGAQAMDYLRQRMGLPNGGYDRDRHVRQYVQAMAQAVVTSDPSDAARLARLLAAAGAGITPRLGGISVLELFVALRDVRPEALVGVRVPMEQDTAHAPGGQSIEMLMSPASGLFAALRADRLEPWIANNPEFTSS